MQNNQKAQEVKTTYDKLKQQLRDFESEYEQLFEKIMEIEQNSWLCLKKLCSSLHFVARFYAGLMS